MRETDHTVGSHVWGQGNLAPDYDARQCLVCGLVASNAEIARGPYSGPDAPVSRCPGRDS